MMDSMITSLKDIPNIRLKELIIQKLDQAPKGLLAKILYFLKFLKAKSRQEMMEVSLLSESSLQIGYVQRRMKLGKICKRGY